MIITEVRFKLCDVNAETGDRLRAFASVVFDGCYKVHDIRVIEGNGGLFVAMPSRKLTDRCRHCREKNHLLAKFCNECGSRLDDNRAKADATGRLDLNTDTEHPIHTAFRQEIERKILGDYEAELFASRRPGYLCRYGAGAVKA